VKVRIMYTVEVGSMTRREIRRFWGKEGLASRDEVKYFFEKHGELGLNNLVRRAELLARK